MFFFTVVFFKGRVNVQSWRFWARRVSILRRWRRKGLEEEVLGGKWVVPDGPAMRWDVAVEMLTARRRLLCFFGNWKVGALWEEVMLWLVVHV